VSDGHGGTDTATVDITVVATGGNQPPSCASVIATPDVLWTPNHMFALVTLTGGSDPDGDPVTITITGVLQNEPVGKDGADSKPGEHSNEVFLRAERTGKGTGRIYTILFTVSDGRGGTCDGSVMVSVSQTRATPGSRAAG
jgi:hypothetical protein